MSKSYAHAISSNLRNYDDFINKIVDKTKLDISLFAANNTINNIIYAKYDEKSLEIKLPHFNLTLTTIDTYKTTLFNGEIQLIKAISFNILEREEINIFNLYIDIDGGISFPNPGDNLFGYHDDKDLLPRYILDSLVEQLVNKGIITPNIL